MCVFNIKYIFTDKPSTLNTYKYAYHMLSLMIICQRIITAGMRIRVCLDGVKIKNTHYLPCRVLKIQWKYLMPQVDPVLSFKRVGQILKDKRRTVSSSKELNWEVRGGSAFGKLPGSSDLSGSEGQARCVL